jgi:hypothetical protein
VLEEVAGVIDETEVAELEDIELADTGTLLIKLETIELTAEEVLTELDSIELDKLELLEPRILLKLTKEEITELKSLDIVLDIEDAELLFDELLDPGVELELATDDVELIALEELETGTLELLKDELETADELLTDDELDELLLGVALKITLRGLLHGIVKSKLIAKKLYCTLHVNPSPDVKVWALALGAKPLDRDDRQSVSTIAEVTM